MIRKKSFTLEKAQRQNGGVESTVGLRINETIATITTSC